MPSWTGNDDEPFDPATTPASPDLGVVPDIFWRLPGVMRSAHPFACAAAGPEAARITSGRLPLPPHIVDSPVGRVYQLDGQVLLLGVGHDADTTLHLAELLAGARYRCRSTAPFCKMVGRFGSSMERTTIVACVSGSPTSGYGSGASSPKRA